ncbi:ADP-ribosylglycohydrolase family protein [Alkaliphilus sp. B6464]|uniref:ADP-ribosylglycohydrolase family protein n=1 Tax=Alkaliphilus sp. B6464 TaxID=2731219 RepID=UPI001BACEA18|nr:ADP-ribosylglycohydrolase family protein [Alkaliphilus sp. B6464]QUH20052.1 ADP-ribosylglycohydrolase family protein [Alkaliphilus sp. B6464]
MYISLLEEVYNFLVEKIGMPDLNTRTENVNLVPLSNIDYRDKIRGAMVSLAIGDAFGSSWEGQQPKEIEHINHFLKGERNTASLKGTWQTTTVILFAESLIINQTFNPEDLANRFIRQPIVGMDKVMEQFTLNYRDHRMEWYRCGIASVEAGAAIRGVPLALVNYGDFTTLKLIGGIQTIITHMDETAVAASILFSSAVAYLLNTPAFSMQSKNDFNLFIDTLCKSIKGIETKVYPTGKNGEIANLYIMVNRILKEWIDKSISIEEIKKQWGSSANSLEAIPLSLYIFLKNPNDYEKTLKECLTMRETDIIVTMVLALLGAYLGFNNIPKGYINKLDIDKEILTLSDRLFELSLKNKSNNPYRRMRDQIEIERSQDELDKLLWLGIKYNKEEEYEMSIKYFEELITKSPDFKKNERVKLHIIEAYEGLGSKLLDNEAYEDALRCFKKALIYDLNHPTILCDMAVTYLNIDDLDKAEKYARRAVEIAPEYEIGREVLEGIKSLQNKS